MFGTMKAAAVDVQQFKAETLPLLKVEVQGEHLGEAGVPTAGGHFSAVHLQKSNPRPRVESSFRFTGHSMASYVLCIFELSTESPGPSRQKARWGAALRASGATEAAPSEAGGLSLELAALGQQQPWWPGSSGTGWSTCL